ncbi:MAG: hypothetical protein JWM47_958, partial [Acidimicrobiales bacterium]|nr:hypothetical protein [Acidimicrobiales bacterium]
VGFGANATFTSVVAADPLPTAVWQSSTDGGATWSVGSPATVTAVSGGWTSGSIIRTTAQNDNMLRRVTWSNSEGSVESRWALLHVSSSPSITQQPSNQTADPGASVSFVSAANGGPSPTPQWQTRPPGSSTFVDVPGATSTTYTVSAALEDEGRAFRCNWTNVSYLDGTLWTVSSAAAVLHVNQAPAVTTQPQDKTVLSGTSASFTAAARAYPAAATQWQRSLDGGATFADVSATTGTLSVTASASLDGARYRAVFTNTLGTATSVPATLTIGSAPTVITPPSPTSVEVGGTAAFTASFSGVPQPTIQWQRLDAGTSAWSSVAGQTSPSISLTVDATMNLSQFRAVATNSFGTVNTTAAMLALPGAPAITSQPSAASVPLGSPASFSVEYAGGTEPVTVEWQRRASGSTTYDTLNGAAEATHTFTPTLADHAATYRAVLSSAGGGAVSAAAKLTVEAPPVITSQPTDATSAYPTNKASFSYTATGTPTIAFQWQRSADAGVTWVNTSTTSAIPSVFQINTTQSMDGWLYRVVLTNAYGTVASDPAVLYVNWPPAITAQPVARTVTVGSSVTFSVSAGGRPLNYQWQQGVLGFGGYVYSNVSGATGPSHTFTPGTSDSAKVFRVIVSNSYGTVTSTSALLTVQTPPTVSTNPVSRTVRPGASTTFTASAIGSPAPTVVWQRSNDGGATWAVVPGATSTSYVLVSAALADDGARFRAVFTNSVASTASAAAVLHVDGAAPSITGSMSPPPNGAGWNSSSVIVSWSCDDAGGSGVASCSGPRSVTTEGRAQVITGTAVDAAGNTSTVGVSVSIDKTAPTITAQTAAVPASGWFTGPVDVTFACSDANGTEGSGVETCPAGNTITDDGSHRTATGTVTDVAGWSSSATVDVAIDATPPTIAGTVAPAGPGLVTVRWTCTDSLSGVGWCPPEETVSVLGHGTLTRAAIDVAGNTSAPATVLLSRSVYGEPVVLSAHTTLGRTGSMTFTVDGTVLASKSVTSGRASVTTTKLALGTRHVAVSYRPTSTATPVVIDDWWHEVEQAGSTTALGAPASAVVGQSVTLTARVTGALPSTVAATGTVVFTDGSTVLTTRSLSNGVATLKISATLGAHRFGASYLATSLFAGSTSVPVDQEVGPATTAVLLSSTANPSVSGQNVTLRAKVSAEAPGIGTPQGAVAIYDGPVLLATRTLSSGAASIIVKPAAGDRDYMAVYLGSQPYLGSTSPVLTQHITRASTVVTVTSPYPIAPFGRTGNLTIKVAPVTPASGTPTGTVDLYDSGGLVATLTLVTGKASLPLATLSRGSHVLTVIYAGVPSFLPGATTTPFSQVIT